MKNIWEASLFHQAVGDERGHCCGFDLGSESKDPRQDSENSRIFRSLKYPQVICYIAIENGDL